MLACWLDDQIQSNQIKSNQSLLVWSFSYQKVAQSASQRLKTTTEIKKQQRNQEKKIKRTQTPQQTCTNTYTLTHTLAVTTETWLGSET